MVAAGARCQGTLSTTDFASAGLGIFVSNEPNNTFSRLEPIGTSPSGVRTVEWYAFRNADLGAGGIFDTIMVFQTASAVLFHVEGLNANTSRITFMPQVGASTGPTLQLPAGSWPVNEWMHFVFRAEGAGVFSYSCGRIGRTKTNASSTTDTFPYGVGANGGSRVLVSAGASFVGMALGWPFNTGERMYTGCGSSWSTFNGFQFLGGIAELRVHNEFRSDAVIQANKDNYLPQATNLKNYWRFNELNPATASVLDDFGQNNGVWEGLRANTVTLSTHPFGFLGANAELGTVKIFGFNATIGIPAQLGTVEVVGFNANVGVGVQLGTVEVVGFNANVGVGVQLGTVEVIGFDAIAENLQAQLGTVEVVGFNANVGVGVQLGTVEVVGFDANVGVGVQLGTVEIVGFDANIGIGAQLGTVEIVGFDANIGIGAQLGTVEVVGFDAITDNLQAELGTVEIVGFDANVGVGAQLGTVEVVGFDANVGVGVQLGTVEVVGFDANVGVGVQLGTVEVVGFDANIGIGAQLGTVEVVGFEAQTQLNVSEVGYVHLVGFDAHLGNIAQLGTVEVVGFDANIGVGVQLGTVEVVGFDANIGIGVQLGTVEVVGFDAHLGNVCQLGQIHIVGYQASIGIQSLLGQVEINGFDANVGVGAQLGTVKITGFEAIGSLQAELGYIHIIGYEATGAVPNVELGYLSFRGYRATTKKIDRRIVTIPDLRNQGVNNTEDVQDEVIDLFERVTGKLWDYRASHVEVLRPSTAYLTRIFLSLSPVLDIIKVEERTETSDWSENTEYRLWKTHGLERKVGFWSQFVRVTYSGGYTNETVPAEVKRALVVQARFMQDRMNPALLSVASQSFEGGSGVYERASYHPFFLRIAKRRRRKA